MINNPNGIKNSYVKESLILAFAIIVAGVSFGAAIRYGFESLGSSLFNISTSLNQISQALESIAEGLIS